MGKYIILAAVSLPLLVGCNTETPVSVELGQNQFWGTPQLTITSVTDEVTVNAVDVNRGNCKSNPHQKMPYTLSFGTSFKIDTPACQNVLEVNISTSDGDFSFSF